MNLIGLDIGGTKCAVLFGELSNGGNIKVLDKLVYPTSEYRSPDRMLPKLQNGITEILKRQQLSVKDIAAIGISCGGPLDSKQGVVMSPPNLPGWDDVHIVKYFENQFSIPVAIQNDANACALAEWKFGAGRGTSNMIFLTFGTGLGAGLILDGKLYSGTNDNAGEVGHIRLENFGPVGYGKSGSFEGFCSGGGIAQLARLKAIETFQMGGKVAYCKEFDELMSVTAQDVAEAANNGDPLALSVYETCGTYMGKGLAVLIDILNPECIVIGSIYIRSSHLLISSLEKTLNIESLPLARKVCRIVPAELEEQIGDIASLSVAADKI
ncbi:MAG: ROK family protein [Bacteroidales bacterium]|nr:ROK family protein [Bacteroidales bacterium]